jgi:hypothetical protein
MEERHDFSFRVLSQRAEALPVTDPRRIAFFANSMDPFAKSMFSGLPVPDTRFTQAQWSTVVALHFGLPIPALKPHVGKTIKTGKRKRNGDENAAVIVDAYGHFLLSTTAQCGGDFQHNHISICNIISVWLRKASLSHRGGSSDRTCKGIFGAACPPIDEAVLRLLNGIIPDFLLQFAHCSPDEHALAGRDHLADTKTLNASKAHYHRTSTDFGFAVNKRQSEVKSEYVKHAEKLDAMYHPQPGDAATFKSILNEYGKDGKVLGLVVGFMGEASSDVHEVADFVATRLASKHLEFFRTAASVAKALKAQQIHRAWGHSFVQGYARVILNRARDNLDSVPGAHGQADERDADADFNFFNPPSAGAGNGR